MRAKEFITEILDSAFGKLTETQYNDYWAVDKHADKATLPHQNRIKNGTYDNYELMWLNIEDVFSNAHPSFALDVNDPVGGKNSIKGRVQRAKDHWESGGYMDPSELGYNDSNGAINRGTIDFTDGRHRMVAAYHRGEEYAPALVPKEDVAQIKSLVRTK